jgi:hypothetical protein
MVLRLGVSPRAWPAPARQGVADEREDRIVQRVADEVGSVAILANALFGAGTPCDWKAGLL